MIYVYVSLATPHNTRCRVDNKGAVPEQLSSVVSNVVQQGIIVVHHKLRLSVFEDTVFSEMAMLLIGLPASACHPGTI